jgi:hypothetical protein
VATYQFEPDPIAGKGDVIAGDPGQRGIDKVLLGRLIESGPRRRLFLDVSGEQVAAILGKRGTGKSYTLGVLLEGLASGEGSGQLADLQTPRAGLVFDIMDIFWTSRIPLVEHGSAEVSKQYKAMTNAGYHTQPLAVDVWIPAGFESPEIDPPGVMPLHMQASDLELDDWAALFDVDIYNEPRGMLIADALMHVSRDGYITSAGEQIHANGNYSFSDILRCLDTDRDLLANYRPETIRSIRQRMTTYAGLALFSGAGTALTALLSPFRVSILMLARVPDALKKVVVAVLLKRILRVRRDASFAQKRLDLDSGLAAAEADRLRAFIQGSIPRTWILMDEAHVLAGTSEGSVARDALVKYAKEGRNYGLSLAVATQQPTALDPRLMSQAETLIVHQLTSPSDAGVATANLRSPGPTSLKIDGDPATIDALLRRMGQGEAVFSCGNAPALQRICLAAIRPRVTAHGGYEA